MARITKSEVEVTNLTSGCRTRRIIKNRQEIISLLQALPQTSLVDFEEFLYFIEQNQLHGKGIGFVDIHLLASSKLGQLPLWTTDKRLQSASASLNLEYKIKR